MNWIDWILVGVLTLGALSTIAIIGRPREPLDPGVAAWLVLINVLLIIGLLLTH